MPLVAVDCRFAGTHSGLGRYTRELVMHLLKRPDPVTYALVVRRRDEEWLKDLSGKPLIFACDAAHYSLGEQWKLPRLLAREGVDLLFAPHFNVPLRCPVPFVVTIHDLILHRFPNRASSFAHAIYKLVITSAIARARSIIAVSDFVAGEIATTFGEDARGKIVTVPEGVTPHFRPRGGAECAAALAKYGIAVPYLLYVGNAKEHKNVDVLLGAFGRLSGSSLSLVLVTGGAEAQKLRLPPRVKLLSVVAEEDLPSLYSAADALVTASAYEGFCLPAAEALCCGCPVIAANRGAIPEVTHGKAILVEPTADAFAAAMRYPPKREAASCPWRWERAAEATARVLIAACHS